MDNVVIGLGRVLDMFLNLYLIIVIFSAIISWVNPDPYNPIVRFLRQATEPLYYRIRRTVPVIIGTFDLSPIIVIAIIYFLKYALVQNLIDWGRSLR